MFVTDGNKIRPVRPTRYVRFSIGRVIMVKAASKMGVKKKTKPKVGSKSNEKIKSYFGVSVYKNTHADIKRLKDKFPTPVIHGTKIWDSSLLVMDYLENNPMEHKSRIMELGCGWGLLGIYCAKTFDAKVTGVDADANVFPFLQAHADLNDVKIKQKTRKFEDLKKTELARQDLIIGTDICFWDDLTDALLLTIKKSIKAGVKEIIIADPGRSPFMDLAKKCKKEFKGKCIEWEVNYPKVASGYLLIITNE